MDKEIINMFTGAINNKDITGFKAYYKTNDKITATPEYTLPILKLYMEEFQNQYPQAKLLYVENQRTGELIESNII
jgi:hypothetical protein